MQLSGFLDIAITLVATFVLVSLLCTTLNELISSLLRTRAATLHRTVFGLIDNKEISDAFFSHGLIKALGTGSSSGKNSAKPSYIDGHTFADALFGVLTPGAPIPGVAEVQARLAHLPEGQLKDALNLAVASAQEGATDMRQSIALWFDNTMDRLSGSYTRYMKVLSLLVGFVVAAALNIDAIDLTRASWNQQVRTTALAIVEKSNPNSFATCEGEDRIKCLVDDLIGTSQKLDGLPVGWDSLPPDEERTTWWWLTKLIGWIIVALAASVGAPFWFDILQNVMSLRGAGVKREEPLADKAAK